MITLVDSLRERGQQTAIEVMQIDHGRYGLISGWRRVQALRHLEVDAVLAIIRTPQDSADAYLAMVEENEIRVGLSYYEPGGAEYRVALNALFHAASRPKRSKIGSFVSIVRALDDHLRFPTALTERTGLALSQALEADAALAGSLVAALAQAAPQTAELEAAVLATALTPAASPPAPQTSAVGSPQSPTLAESSRDLGGGLRYKRTAKGEIVLSDLTPYF